MSGNSEDEEDSDSCDREEESLDGLENNDFNAQLVSSKSPSCKVWTLNCRFLCVIGMYMIFFIFIQNIQ